MIQRRVRNDFQQGGNQDRVPKMLFTLLLIDISFYRIVEEVTSAKESRFAGVLRGVSGGTVTRK